MAARRSKPSGADCRPRPRRSCGRSFTARTRRRTWIAAAFGDLAAAARPGVAGQAAGAAQGGGAVAGDRPRRTAAGHGPRGRRRRRSSRTSSCAATRNQPGEAVPRQFLAVLAGPGRKPFTRRQRPAGAGPGHRQPRQSADGARAGQPRLAAPLRPGPGRARPATSACAATRPAHPELLDHLATTFMDDGWSIKKLHRLILLSATYQQAQRRPPRVPPRSIRRTAAVADEPPAARLRGDARRPAGRRRAGWTAPSAGRRCTTSCAPRRDAADAVRLPRPAERAGAVPHLRLPQPRRHQPAARHDHRPAAGPVPDEQPVRIGVRQGAAPSP